MTRIQTWMLAYYIMWIEILLTARIRKEDDTWAALGVLGASLLFGFSGKKENV